VYAPRTYVVALTVGALTSRTAAIDPRRMKATATLLIENREGWVRMRGGVSRTRAFPGPVQSPFSACVYYSNGAVIPGDTDFATG
jgi:hypothetical protein